MSRIPRLMRWEWLDRVSQRSNLTSSNSRWKRPGPDDRKIALGQMSALPCPGPLYSRQKRTYRTTLKLLVFERVHTHVVAMSLEKRASLKNRSTIPTTDTEAGSLAVSRSNRANHIRQEAILPNGQISFIGGADLHRRGLRVVRAGYQSFRRHDGDRWLELRSLAVYSSASTGGNNLDLWILDGT